MGCDSVYCDNVSKVICSFIGLGSLLFQNVHTSYIGVEESNAILLLSSTRVKCNRNEPLPPIFPSQLLIKKWYSVYHKIYYCDTQMYLSCHLVNFKRCEGAVATSTAVSGEEQLDPHHASVTSPHTTRSNGPALNRLFKRGIWHVQKLCHKFPER